MVVKFVGVEGGKYGVVLWFKFMVLMKIYRIWDKLDLFWFFFLVDIVNFCSLVIFFMIILVIWINILYMCICIVFFVVVVYYRLYIFWKLFISKYFVYILCKYVYNWFFIVYMIL